MSEHESVFERASHFVRNSTAPNGQEILRDLTHLTCNATDPEVRKRAGILFGAVNSAVTDRAPRPEPTPAPPPTQTVKYRDPQVKRTAPKFAKKEPVNIPKSAKLPPNFVKYVRGVKNMRGNLPTEMTEVIQQAETEANGITTYAESVEILLRVREKLCTSDLGIDVFSALVSAFYACDFITNKHAQSILEEIEPSVPELDSESAGEENEA